MALSNDRVTQLKSLGAKAYPVKASTTIYAGSLVCLDTGGYAVPAADTAAFTCVGVAHAKAVGGAASGDVWVLVNAPVIALFAATSITQAMVGTMMYVADDQTFDNTSTNGIMAGILLEYVSTTSGWIMTGLTSNPLISGLTSSAAELNILDGATLSVAELNILTGVTATASEINQYTDESVKTEVVSATNVIAASESGKTMFLNSATEFVSTLPAPALGLNYRFIVAAAPSGASYTIVTNASANILKGMQYSAAGDAGDTSTGDDTITFVDGQAVAGDRVDVWSDGTSWFCVAFSKVAAGITFTTAS